MTSSTAARILIVEDEQHLADGLKFNLDAEGFKVLVTERHIDNPIELLFSGPTVCYLAKEA